MVTETQNYAPLQRRATLSKLQNTQLIPEKTESYMQARLNSPFATNMADEISEELGKSWNVCKFRATCPEQMLKKEHMLGTGAVQLKTAIIEATTDLTYHSTSFPLINREGKREKSV